MKRASETYFDRYVSPHMPDFELDSEWDPDLIVVIPAFKEPDLITPLKSLFACDTHIPTQLIVILNAPEDAPTWIQDINRGGYDQIKTLSPPDHIRIHVETLELPPKKAGVGLARKIGMDMAALAFHRRDKNGIIICYDADCSCAPNYLEAIYGYYQSTTVSAGVVHYAHPIVDTRIIDYELHLRYFVDIQRYAAFPLAFQTLGSCMTVRSEAYCKAGGMNTRKAGEDFYFLNKMITIAGLGEINTTTIYPEGRVSDRVPFGTGKAIQDLSSTEQVLYAPSIFLELKALLDPISSLGLEMSKQEHQRVSTVLAHHGWDLEFEKICQNSSQHSFRRNFFRWFDGFKVMKFAHKLRDTQYPNVHLDTGLDWLNEHYWEIPGFRKMDRRNRLYAIRDWDRASDFLFDIKNT